MGGSVANSNVFVVSKRRSVVNSNVFHALAWSKGGKVVNSNVFVCFCMAEGRTCRKVSCFCVFLLGRRGEMSKSVVFLCVFWVKSKSVVFLCVFGFCVFFARSTGASGSLFLWSYANRCKSAGNYMESEGQAYVKD